MTPTATEDVDRFVVGHRHTQRGSGFPASLRGKAGTGTTRVGLLIFGSLAGVFESGRSAPKSKRESVGFADFQWFAECRRDRLLVRQTKDHRALTASRVGPPRGMYVASSQFSTSPAAVKSSRRGVGAGAPRRGTRPRCRDQRMHDGLEPAERGVVPEHDRGELPRSTLPPWVDPGNARSINGTASPS